MKKIERAVPVDPLTIGSDPWFEPPRQIALMWHHAPPGRDFQRWFEGQTSAGDVMILTEASGFGTPWVLTFHKRKCEARNEE